MKTLAEIIKNNLNETLYDSQIKVLVDRYDIESGDVLMFPKNERVLIGQNGTCISGVYHNGVTAILDVFGDDKLTESVDICLLSEDVKKQILTVIKRNIK